MALKLHDTDPYSSRIRTYPEVPCFKTRDVSSECRERIRSDSDLARDTENPMFGYVIETRRVKTWKCSYTCRFAANSGVPYTTSRSSCVFFSSLLKMIVFSTVRIVSLGILVPEIPRY